MSNIESLETDPIFGLAPELPVWVGENGGLCTNSRDVAKYFGVRHRFAMHDIYWWLDHSTTEVRFRARSDGSFDMTSEGWGCWSGRGAPSARMILISVGSKRFLQCALRLRQRPASSCRTFSTSWAIADSVRRINPETGAFVCHDCKDDWDTNAGLMLRDELWVSIGGKQHTMLCYPCTEGRLGRSL